MNPDSLELGSEALLGGLPRHTSPLDLAKYDRGAFIGRRRCVVRIRTAVLVGIHRQRICRVSLTNKRGEPETVDDLITPSTRGHGSMTHCAMPPAEKIEHRSKSRRRWSRPNANDLQRGGGGLPTCQDLVTWDSQ